MPVSRSAFAVVRFTSWTGGVPIRDWLRRARSFTLVRRAADPMSSRADQPARRTACAEGDIMNIPTIHRRARGWHAATIAAMALLGIAHGPVAGASDAGADRGRDAPVWQQVVERRQLRHVVARMPSGWPATEVMRRAIEEPLGDVVQRADW